MQVPDTFDKVIYRLITESKVHHIILTNDGKHRDASHVTRVSVSELKFPAFSFCMGQRFIK